MEVGRLSESGVKRLVGGGIPVKSAPPSESFSEIFHSLESHAKLLTIQTQLLHGKSFSPRELLLLQVQLGRFNMQVELISKVAESANAAARRLQGGGA